MGSPRKPALDPARVETSVGYDEDYPAPFREPCSGREWKALGDAVGLTQFGVNLTTLPPGTWSSQRHWHTSEDEFVYILSGEAVLVTDEGEQTLTAGMAAGFPAGNRDGHHLINKSDGPVQYIEIGTRAATEYGEYPDIDLKVTARHGVEQYFHNDWKPY